MHHAQSTPPAAPMARGQLLRLAPLAALIALAVFPFEWLGTRWHALGHALDWVFPTEAYHSIGHATLFASLGALALALVPSLRGRLGSYLGLFMLTGLAQEALQLVFKERAPAFDDARDLMVDLLGMTIAFALVWLWQRSAAGVRG